MASISYTDLLKRQNVEVLVDRVNAKGALSLGNKDGGDLLHLTGKIKYDGKESKNPSAAEVRMFLENKKLSDKLEVHTKEKSYQAITRFFKEKDFGGVAAKAGGQGTERQEEGIIIEIRKAVKANGPTKIVGIPPRFLIDDAAKNEGLSSIGQEPYIDVYLMTNKGKKIGCSMKGTSAPSLAGGGLGGMNVVVPHLPPLVYKAILKHLKKEGHGHDDVVNNDDLPDFYIQVPPDDVEALLKGNKKMGGPIDYMYIGPMDVTAKMQGSQLKLNGNFYSIDDYMRKIPKFYFRVRKRDLDQDNMVKIDYKNKNKEGFPKVFVSPRTGKNNLRIVIVDKVPGTGKLLKL